MRFIHPFQRNIILSLGLLVIAMGYTAYVTISNIVAEQSRVQQLSASPVFSLVAEEVLKPLHLSEAVAASGVLSKFMDADELDEAGLVSHLKKLSNEFDLMFFAASEKARKQYHSDGSTFDLIEGKVGWYFELKEHPQNTFALLGKRENVHLYIDIKVYNDAGEFLGFIGTGRDLDEFLTTFKKHKRRYGYDIVFVNDKQEVVLTSDEDILADAYQVVSVNQLDWYQRAIHNKVAPYNLNGTLVTIGGEDALITEIHIGALNWTLYLLSPLQHRQADMTQVFINSILILMALCAGVFLAFYHILKYFRRDIESKALIDPLTGLSNRTHISSSFSNIKHSQQSISLIILDIDHFKVINDTYGHNTGDQVLIKIVEIIQGEIRDQDLAGRWGGEEFIILLPNTDIDKAKSIAERIREKIEMTTVTISNLDLHVTASFGITFADRYQSLKDLVAEADNALYEAKRSGRNKVCLQLPDQ